MSILQNFFSNKQPKSNSQPSNNFKNISEDIKNDRHIIVPVVCDDMFVYNKDNKDLTIGDYLCSQINGISEEANKAITQNLFFGISLYEHDKGDRPNANIIYEKIKSGIEHEDIKLRDCVKTFLEQGDFPVIVTTIGFDIIEKALNKALNNNIYYSEWYNPNGRNDFPFITEKQKRVVYHIFGGRDCNTWVYNEQSLLRFIHALHSGDFEAKNLSNYLCGTGQDVVKRPLILGSTLPDWLFRFLIYPLYKDNLPNSYGYWMSLDDIEKGLDLFLTRNKYIKQTNLQEDKIADILKFASPERNLEKCEKDKKEEPVPRKIFFSYKREKEATTDDARLIDELHQMLDKQVDVWRDITSEDKISAAGTPYWKIIEQVVEKCDLFVTIVTRNYLEEFRHAPDITKELSEEDVTRLKPVVREAYYAIKYQKAIKNESVKCASIIVDMQKKMDGGTLDKIFRDKDNTEEARKIIEEEIGVKKIDELNLPSCLFNGRTCLVYNDDKPELFNLPKL